MGTDCTQCFFKVLMCWCKYVFSGIYVRFPNRLLGMQKRHVTTTAHGLGNSSKFISTSSFISRVPACGHIFWRSPELCFRLLKSEITTFSISCVHPEIHYQNCIWVSVVWLNRSWDIRPIVYSTMGLEMSDWVYVLTTAELLNLCQGGTNASMQSMTLKNGFLSVE